MMGDNRVSEVLVFFGSLALYTHATVYEVLGYPVVPATTTNDYWDLVGLNLEMLAVLIVGLPFFVIAAALTTAVFSFLLNIPAVVRLAYGLWKNLKTSDNDY